MKCLRCGYCCQNYAVVIIDDPEKGLAQDNLKVIGENGPERCPHLRGDTPGEFSCSIHDRPWYPQTPCFEHGQIEQSPDAPCRLGEHILDMRDAILEDTKQPSNGVCRQVSIAPKEA